MAGTYGAPNLNHYIIPDLKEDTYYNIVNASTGVTSVYRRGFGTATFVASYNPSTGGLTPNKTAATSFELAAFAKPETIQVIKTQAIATAQRGGATNAQQLISPNSATSPTPPSPTGGSSTAGGSQVPELTEEAINTLAEKGIPGRKPRESYDDLTYPKDLGSSKSDAIQFTMLQYGTKSYDSKYIGLSATRSNKKIPGSVTMSIQPPIADFNAVNWSGSEMGVLAMAAGASSLEFIDQGTSAISNISGKIKETITDEGTVTALTTLAAQEAASTKGLLTRVTGAMFNNNLELLFQGPQLRQFTFTFKMSPRRKEESDDVRKIIRFFKQGSAVQRSVSNLFLKSPNVFELKYLNRRDGTDKDHKSLNKIKTCALISVGVDYTPTGSYMTFNDEDGSMVSYTLSLTFNELEPIYEDEYDKTDIEGIGY